MADRWLQAGDKRAVVGSEKSALCQRIVSVIGLCSKPQMFRIAAQAIVASVTDDQSIWNRAIRQLERHSMRVVLFLSNSADAAIAVFGYLRAPIPARLCGLNIDLGPEALVQRDKQLVSIRAPLRAETCKVIVVPSRAKRSQAFFACGVSIFRARFVFETVSARHRAEATALTGLIEGISALFANGHKQAHFNTVRGPSWV